MKEAARIILFLFLALVYFLIPIDLIPDSMGRNGRIDDLIVFGIVIYYFFFKPLVDEIFPRRKAPTNGSTQKDSVFSTDDPWAILGVKKDASMEEVKIAYHEKIHKYHPDLVDKMGQEIQQVAREKTQALNDAYEKIKSMKG